MTHVRGCGEVQRSTRASLYSRDSVGVRQQCSGEREQQRRAAGARPERAHGAWSAGEVARRTAGRAAAPARASRPARAISTRADWRPPRACRALHRHLHVTARRHLPLTVTTLTKQFHTLIKMAVPIVVYINNNLKALEQSIVRDSNSLIIKILLDTVGIYCHLDLLLRILTDFWTRIYSIM